MSIDRRSLLVAGAMSPIAIHVGFGNTPVGKTAQRRIQAGQIGTKHAHAARKFQTIRKYPDEKDARLIYAAMASQRPGGAESAEQQYAEILALDPYYAEVWNQLAYLYAGRGDFAGADTLIDRYVELQPGRQIRYIVLL